MFLTAFLAFYISKNLYNGYIIKRDPGAFILSLSFFTFGTVFLFHALALYHLPFFYDEMFDVTEHYGLFLGSLILIGFLVPYKKDSERLYKNRLGILAGISTFFIPGVFILATFQSFGKFLASYINSALILTGILILIVIVFLMQGYRRVANRRMSTFFIIGFSILINSAVVPFFYNEWSLVWWYFHLTFILAFIFVLAELLLHRERIEDLGDVFIYTSFGTKLVMAFSVLSAFFFVVLFNMFLTLSGDVIFKSSLNSFEMDVAEHASQSANSLSDVGSNILFISELPEIKSGVKSGNDRARMKTFFKNIISEHPAYSRLRYINEDGQEVISVESIDRKAYVALDKDLKSRKESYYFKEAINEEKDKIYASYMDLNAEDAGGEIKMPYIPIIRLATPAFSEKNEKRGVVIADIFGLDIISHIEYEYALNNSIFIVDQDGFYTYNKQDKRKEWGSSRDLGSGENIKNDIPDLAKYILSGRSGSIEGERDVAAYAVFFPSQKHKERFMSIVVVASKEALLAPLTGLKKKVILFGLVIVSIFIALMFFLVRRATLYIKKISDASTEIKNGDFSKRVEITTKDEMGQLAESFNAMVDKFVGLNIDLDKKVQERTSQLSESLRDIRKFQQAVDSTTDNVIILDKDLKIIYANNAWEKMTGY
ncbi:HAMP domain-containing protein [Candidatus Azambacteria bacterium]|nr:HAMP domain-containing protein [Candidatus Azambacteria bacterium]